MFDYVEKFLSPFLCGYRKGYSAQQAYYLCLKNEESLLIMGDMEVEYLWICPKLLIP